MSVAALRFAAGATAAESSPAVAVGAANPLAAEAEGVVTLVTELGAADDEGWRSFRIKLAIEKGWHLNANPASQEFLIPTKVEAAGSSLRAVSYPEGIRLEAAFAEEEILVYEGQVEVRGELKPGEAEASPKILFTFQPCDVDRCLPPVTRELAF